MPVGREVEHKKPEKAAAKKAKKTSGVSKPERGTAAKAKTAAKKAPAKKAVAAKPKTPAKKAVVKKAPARKAVAAKAKAPAKKAAAPKAGAKKTVAAKAKAPAKKAAAPKAGAKKTVAAKTTVPRTAAKKAPAAKSAPPKKTARKATPAKAPAAAKKPSASRANGASSPPPRPSERAMAVSAQVPVERALTDEEREAMAKVSATAKRFLSAEGTPAEIVARVGVFIDEVRSGKRPEPKSNDVRLGLGVLWGDQVRAQVGWRWVHLTYGHLDFASYALVPDDRAFACFPLNRIPDLMTATANTSVLLFEKIRAGELPPRRDNAYLVIG